SISAIENGLFHITYRTNCTAFRLQRLPNYQVGTSLSDVKRRRLLLGSGVVDCLIQQSPPRGRQAGPCRADGRCARTERNQDTTATCPARYPGAAAARSAAATRSPQLY